MTDLEAVGLCSVSMMAGKRPCIFWLISLTGFAEQCSIRSQLFFLKNSAKIAGQRVVSVEQRWISNQPNSLMVEHLTSRLYVLPEVNHAEGSCLGMGGMYREQGGIRTVVLILLGHVTLTT